MVRTDITTSKLAQSSDVAEPAGTAIDQPNGMRIIPGTGHNDRLLLRITNTSGATKQVTIAKSTSSQVNTDQVTSPIAATTGVGLVRVQPAMIQPDGTLWLNFVAGHTGVITAYEMLP
jgi:hypothetical protein